MSEPETESDRPRKMAQLGRRQYEGIGPVTNDGMPIILRSVKHKSITSLAHSIPGQFPLSTLSLSLSSRNAAGGPGTASA